MLVAFSPNLSLILCPCTKPGGWRCSLDTKVKILRPKGRKGAVDVEGERCSDEGVCVCVWVRRLTHTGRVVSRMEGINHYWRTPSSPTHPDGPSTPDINHHSPTIDPLSLLRREKSVLVVLIFPFSPSAFTVSPPPRPAKRIAVSLWIITDLRFIEY